MRSRFSTCCFGLLCLALATSASSQEAKPYKEGPVTQLSYIKIKPGKFDDYMAYLAGPYKKLMDAQKKEGLVTSYAVYSATARTPNEPDLILAVTVPNMATLDKVDESDAIAAKIMGNNQAQNKGTIDRGAMRDVLGGELVRELILK